MMPMLFPEPPFVPVPLPATWRRLSLCPLRPLVGEQGLNPSNVNLYAGLRLFFTYGINALDYRDRCTDDDWHDCV